MLFLQARAASTRSPRPISRICRSGRRADIALGHLSGGNQQKVALAKWLTYLPKVLILSEPTRGMDVGAKEDVIRIVKSLRDQGVAVAGAVDRAGDDPDAGRPRDRAEARQVAREFASGHIEKADLLGRRDVKKHRRPGGTSRRLGHDDSDGRSGASFKH